MSWAKDDCQLISVEDGVGWDKKPRGFYNSRLWAVRGDPREAVFHDVPGYPDLSYASSSRQNQPNYYSFGTLALDGRIYQFLSTLNRAELRHWIGTKLIYSPDNGRTWCNQNGSSPVVWESWVDQSRENMVFFEEPQETFSLLSILQMGRNYEANQDGYVYVYAPNGNTDGTMNELVMFRVPKAQILDRGAYEYFAGQRPDEGAKWVKDINARAVVHTFPRRWVNTASGPEANLVVEAWLPSVVYNAAVGLYLMANCGIGCALDGSAFGKPSYLGFWVAPDPWGPWTQIHEESAWTPANDPAARAYDLQVAPKWIGADGKSFWLVWADIQGLQEFARASEQMAKESKPTDSEEERSKAELRLYRRYLPRYAFNTQRFDLILA